MRNRWLILCVSPLLLVSLLLSSCSSNNGIGGDWKNYIGDIATSNITGVSATITWHTNYASTSTVEYGVTAASHPFVLDALLATMKVSIVKRKSKGDGCASKEYRNNGVNIAVQAVAT